jgi:hypothetical protein
MVLTPSRQQLLLDLASKFYNDRTVAIALFGSYARGDATPFSDLDLVRFTDVPSADERTLHQRGDLLISLWTSTIQSHYSEMSHPWTACRCVVGIRQAQSLIDPTGAFAALQAVAFEFKWELLQDAAGNFSSNIIFHEAENARKIMGALLTGNESAMVFGITELCQNLTRALTVQRGELITSESSYFEQAQRCGGLDTSWTRLLRIAAGVAAGSPDYSPLTARAHAVLELYHETALLLHSILRAEHIAVIDATVKAIESRVIG